MQRIGTTLFILYLLGAACSPTDQSSVVTADFLLSPEELPGYESTLDHAGILENLDEEAYFRGMKVYNAVCFDCHGNKEFAGSLPTANKFWQDTFKIGHDYYSMYQTITRGYGLMPPQIQLSPQEKYEVIHYLHQHFIKEENPNQFFELTPSYLASLPKGNTKGPDPVAARPWFEMDYGNFLINTYEVSGKNAPPRNMSRRNAPLKDEDWSWANWAYKGIAIRLDEGKGGIAAGKSWLVFDHDLLRVAGGWSGKGFIDWNEILMDGKHNISPRTIGDLHFSNPTLPGWANPNSGSFTDPRFTARDGRQFGPLPKKWAQYLGLYHHEGKTIISYKIGNADILEMPSIEYSTDKTPIYIRNLHIRNAFPGLKAHIAGIQHGVEILGDSVQLVQEEAQQYIVVDHSGELKLKIAITEKPSSLVGFIERTNAPQSLLPFTQGGRNVYPERLNTTITSRSAGPFEVDVLTSPKDNPWKSRMRFGGIDFFKNTDEAVAVCTEGDVWRISGLHSEDGKLIWQRIGTGLFQPLGVKIIKEEIFITCRDQLVKLHDYNNDGQVDFYESYNNDHQVTDHFHEFAMGLQTDAEGNFYYAKSGRHAREALVPQHGTLIKVSPDGSKSEIIAFGFRAANGVCINPDGSFIVTDQEGYWNPMNRVNWVAGTSNFYGNMWGYGAPKDSSDQNMVQPLTWVDSKMDRSPAELLWVDSPNWGPLKGSLLSLSYGYGKVYLIPHEKIGNQVQGGIYELPIPPFKTGLIRGRFNPGDGHLYVCGMSAWATNQVYEPGGFYRIRYNGQALHAPIELQAKAGGMLIRFTDPIDPASAENMNNFKVSSWDLKRSRKYGSDRYNRKSLKVEAVTLSTDRQSLYLSIPDIQPTWQMEIQYQLIDIHGKSLTGVIQNTIHQLDQDWAGMDVL